MSYHFKSYRKSSSAVDFHFGCNCILHAVKSVPFSTVKKKVISKLLKNVMRYLPFKMSLIETNIFAVKNNFRGNMQLKCVFVRVTLSNNKTKITKSVRFAYIYFVCACLTHSEGQACHMIARTMTSPSHWDTANATLNYTS